MLLCAKLIVSPLQLGWHLSLALLSHSSTNYSHFSDTEASLLMAPVELSWALSVHQAPGLLLTCGIDPLAG